ncbi:MAG: SufD family Fe-S cluster assembly protein [Desulfurococcales archaeon]|nr:SufD family Fe-S cluster assembly protein [Desulfurococcales archaeon]
MNALRSRYMELARREAFQEIADSPTVKYYTNWREFERRLDAADSKDYPSLPEWLEALEPRKLVITDRAAVDGIKSSWIRIYSDYDVIGDLKVAGKLEYLHAARAKPIVELRIPEGVDAGSILVVSMAGEAYTGHHLRVILEPESSVELLVADLGNESRESLKTLTTVYEVSEGASLKQYVYANHGNTAVYVRRIYRLGTGSRLELNTLYSGGPSTRVNEDIFLNGQYSEARVVSSAVSRETAWSDVLLNVRHRGPRSRAFVEGRGVVLNRGLLTLRGIAIVEEEAEWSASHVEVHVSTFGEEAKGYASPMLEIHTGNVEEAFHSASVASIGEDELFYLKSRGLNEAEARELLIEGIVNYSGVIERMKIPYAEVAGR